MSRFSRAITDRATWSTLHEQWTPHRDRVLWSPVLFGAGIALYFSLKEEPGILHAASVLAISVIICLAIWRRYPAFFFATVALFLMVLGFNVALWRSHMVEAPQIAREAGPTMITGTVLDVTIADENDGKTKRRVTIGSLTADRLTPENTPATIRLTSYHIPSDVGPGDYIRVLAKLMPPSGPVAPEGFDYRRQAFFEQIGAVGFTLGKFELLEDGEPGQVTSWFNALRGRIAQKITHVLPAPESAVATALLAGERAGIPKDVDQDLKDSGLYHLLSISGLHVAIVCGVTFFTLRFLMALWPYAGLRLPIKKIAAAAALLVGLAYMMLAGSPVPTQRAMIMTGLMLLAVMLDRSALSLRTIALAALFVLAFHPEALVGASFQLSFAAMLSMIAFYEGVGRDWFVSRRDSSLPTKISLYFAGIIITTILVSFATLPAGLHHFGRVQLMGILGNAAAIPLTSFIIMPFGMLAMLMMPFGLEALFLKIANWGIDALLEVAHWVAHLPGATVALPGLPVPYFVTASFGFLLLCLWRGSIRWLGVPVMLAAVVWGCLTPRADALMDRDARSLGVKGEAEIAYALKTPREFTRNNWIAYWGGTEYQDGKPVREGIWQSGITSMVCDDWACRITSAGRNLSLLKHVSALPQECLWASLVIVLDKAAYKMKCDAPHINGWDVKDSGGYAFYAREDGWIAAPFTDTKDNRPWTMRDYTTKTVIPTQAGIQGSE